jgi:hypothetical protein
LSRIDEGFEAGELDLGQPHLMSFPSRPGLSKMEV